MVAGHGHWDELHGLCEAMMLPASYFPPGYRYLASDSELRLIQIGPITNCKLGRCVLFGYFSLCTYFL